MSAQPIIYRVELRQRALEVWCLAEPSRKADEAQALLRQARTGAALDAVWRFAGMPGAFYLEVILRDEIGHVPIGNRWYAWLCERQGLDPVQHCRALVERYAAPRLKPPFNRTARLAAGFSEAELASLTEAVP